MTDTAVPAPSKPLYRHLYAQVLCGIVLGTIVALLFPDFATNRWIKALGDDFVKLIKMMIVPIIFCTVVSGISHIESAKKVGRVGVKAMIYFELISTFALVIGLVIGNVARPGQGFGGAKASADAVASYAKQGAEMDAVKMLSNIIPDTFFSAFTQGDILQALFVAILVGCALMAMGERGAPVRTFIDEAGAVVFRVFTIVLKVAPIGAFGAITYIIGKYGAAAIGNLLFLIATFYLAAIIFIVVVLGVVARVVGFNIFRFVAYIRDELFIVLGTSSSESALPHLMEKLERLGCSRSVVGLVVPAGYSFNLDGTNLYMTLATTFIAQALGVDLSLGQQLTIVGIAMLTSKGASGITGAGFITLAATLSVIDPALVPGMAIVFGIDKFMSECRALTNIVGNGVATIVVSWWEGELDRTKLNRVLSGQAGAG